MNDEDLLDELCKARLTRRGYAIFHCRGGEGYTLIEQIKQRSAEYHGVRLRDLNGRSRTDSVALARQVAMYLAKELTPMTYKEVGQEFGRDHATVIWAHNAVKRLSADDPAVAKSLVDIRNGLR